MLSDPGDDDEVQRVAPGWALTPTLAALYELVEVADAAPREVARRAEWSTTELHTLRFLSQGPLSPSQLARRLGITTAASSGVIDRLCRRGYARRRSDPRDGRRTEVVVTEAGRAAALARLAPMLRALAELDERYTAAERVTVESYLRGATAALRSLL